MVELVNISVRTIGLPCWDEDPGSGDSGPPMRVSYNSIGWPSQLGLYTTV